MKKLLYLCIACCIVLSCTKDKGVTYTGTTTPNDSNLITSFISYTDTFTGVFEARIGEEYLTNDSSQAAVYYVHHYSPDSIMIVGNSIEASYNNGVASYAAGYKSFDFQIDSTGVYVINNGKGGYPVDTVVLHNDSLNISINTISGLDNELQTFAGKTNK